jgi:hypothetical protein
MMLDLDRRLASSEAQRQHAREEHERERQAFVADQQLLHKQVGELSQELARALSQQQQQHRQEVAELRAQQQQQQQAAADRDAVHRRAVEALAADLRAARAESSARAATLEAAAGERDKTVLGELSGTRALLTELKHALFREAERRQAQAEQQQQQLASEAGALRAGAARDRESAGAAVAALQRAQTDTAATVTEQVRGAVGVHVLCCVWLL